MAGKARDVVLVLLFVFAGTPAIADERVVVPEIPYSDEGQIRDLIDIEASADVDRIRAQLVDYVWKGAGLPDRGPDDVQTDVAPPSAFVDVQALVRTDRVIVELPHGFAAVAHHFHARAPNDGLAVVHGGHGNTIAGSRHIIEPLLQAGFSVLGFDMPVYGDNRSPEYVETEDFGRITVRGRMHNEFALFDTDEFSALSLFLEPVAVALNHALKTNVYRHVSMTGVSGGGWTTTAYAALDPRIEFSMPVAGSSAFYLLYRDGLGYGDYEQTLPAFYAIANYLELYVLASHGREMIQVHNKYEPGAFGGLGGTTYADVVSTVTEEIGGSYRLHLDTTIDRHDMSPAAIEMLIKTATQALERASN